MTSSFVVLCVAAVALVAFTTSALSGLGLWLARKPLRRIAPSGQARVLLAVSLAPVFIAAIAMVAVLAPSFGWLADHCAATPIGHAHPHMCTAHPASSLPAIPILLLSASVFARLLWVVVDQVGAWTRAQIALRRLGAQSQEWDGDTPDVRILTGGGARAFVLGLTRPTLFVTEGLVRGEESRHLEAVLAHERAHIERKDSLVRFIAGFGYALHLPFVARWLRRTLATSQELAADRAAATAVGSERIARALVALSRPSAKTPTLAFGFTGTEIEARVAALLQPTPVDRPKPITLVIVALAAMFITALAADPIHHGLETVLGAFGA